MRLLDQLCATGSALRWEDSTDRRAKVLALTAAGQAVIPRMEVDLDHFRKAVFAAVDMADLKARLRAIRTGKGCIHVIPAIDARSAATWNMGY